MFPLKVSVTPELIAEATASRERPSYAICSDCLIALAMSKAAGQPVEVGLRTWWVGADEVRPPFEGILPDEAIVARRAFDGFMNVAPFEFEVRPDTIRVEVTQELIDQAIANRSKPDFHASKECLGAVALKSILPNEYISVGVENALINGQWYKVGDLGAAQIRAFINREPVTPFTLTLHAVLA